METDTIPTTRDVLRGMFTENTGRHMLDSGGAYGRHWERNQGRQFDNEPHAVISLRWGYIDVTYNTYQWLAERVEYDHEMQQEFLAFANQPENEHTGWLELMERFVTEVRGGAGIYNDGKPFTTNTYNGECLLDQTLQFTYWTEEETGEEFILLQVHGGCDVRGGYTAPVVFSASIEDRGIFDYAKGTIVEDLEIPEGQTELPLGRHENPYWWSDDGVHWYFEGSCGTGFKQLETYDIVEASELEDMTQDERDEFVKGKLWTDEQGRPRGPNGGVLKAYFT